MDDIKRDLGRIKQNIRNLSRRITDIRKSQSMINKSIAGDINRLAEAISSICDRVLVVEIKTQQIETALSTPAKVVGFQVDENANND